MLFGILISLFGAAVVAPFIVKYRKKYSGWILSIIPLAIFGILASRIPMVSRGEIISSILPWIPSMGISLNLQLDGLGLMFGLLVSGIGGLILIYAGYYMRSYPRTGRFFAWLVFFVAAMMGLALSTNLIALFMFWEFTSISSFLLIGFKHEKRDARDAALQALLVTGLGGLALLAGFILMSLPYGSFELGDIMAQPELFTSSPYFLPAMILVLIGAFTKSAIFPFHFWLPGAMQAPSPVSALLHSATMVKAGVFLLARLNPLMQESMVWSYSLSLAGVITMFVGAWLSISQNDIKKILAYTTISALGTLTLLLGSNTSYSLNAFVVFLLVHAFYKATLFMMAGNIEKQTGTRQLPALGQLAAYMPVSALISLVALLSMSGLPPMLGFIGKELVYEAKLNSPDAAGFILTLGFAANACMVFVSARLAIDVFKGEKREYSAPPREPEISLLTGPAILVAISVVLGLFPSFIEAPIVTPVLQSINPGTETKSLKIWHGFNLVLLLSALTIATGVLMYTFKEKIIRFARYMNRFYFRARFSRVFFRSIDGFIDLTQTKTRFVQHGYHRYYLMTIFVTATALTAFMLLRTPMGPLSLKGMEKVPFFYYGIGLLIVLSSIAALSAASRLVAFISIGLTGFGISVIFLIFSGIDLAITMILVETLMVILGAMVVYHLPKYVNISRPTARIRDAVIALAFGAMMFMLVLKTATLKESEKISDYFSHNSYPLGHGKNIVNVILVDFRALDTLGEILVLTVAAIGVWTLIKLNRKPKQL